MANKVKGEVQTTTGHTMVFDFNAMAELEDIAGRDSREVLAKFDDGTVGINDLRAFYLACLRRHHPDLSLFDAGDIAGEDPTAWQRVLEAAQPDAPKGAAPGNVKARPKKAAG